MAFPPYTETFLYATGVNTTTTWTVPDGKRAVITSVLASSGIAGAVALVRLHGHEAMFFAIPVKDTTIDIACRVVVYQRRTISCFCNAVGGMHVHISGYLFDDKSGAVGPPGQQVERQWETGEVLPAAEAALNP